jgi:hypothetical protein
LCMFSFHHFQGTDDKKGMKTLFENVLMMDKRISIFDYPLR